MLYISIYMYTSLFKLKKKGKRKIVISSLQDERNCRQTDYSSIDVNLVFH